MQEVFNLALTLSCTAFLIGATAMMLGGTILAGFAIYEEILRLKSKQHTTNNS